MVNVFLCLVIRPDCVIHDHFLFRYPTSSSCSSCDFPLPCTVLKNLFSFLPLINYLWWDFVLSFSISYSLSFSVMLSRIILDFIVLVANISEEYIQESVSLISAVGNVAVEAAGVLRYPPTYLANEYTSRYVPCLDSR